MFELLILGLATHRLTTIWSIERITQRLREWTFTTFLQPLTSCPFCVSVWIAAGLWAAWRWGGIPGQAVAYVFAISNVTIFAEFALRKLAR